MAEQFRVVCRAVYGFLPKASEPSQSYILSEHRKSRQRRICGIVNCGLIFVGV